MEVLQDIGLSALGIVFFILLITFPLTYAAGLFIAPVFGLFKLIYGNRWLGGGVLVVWALVFLPPIIRAEVTAYQIRSELDALREIPEGLSFQGTTVVFTVYDHERIGPCGGLCHWAMEDGNVTVYAVLLETDTQSEGLRRDNMFRVVPNPEGTGYGDWYILEPVAAPESVEIDYLVAAVFELRDWYSANEGGLSLDAREWDTGLMVLDGWPSDAGQIVVNLTQHPTSTSFAGLMLVDQTRSYYPPLPDQTAAQMRMLCGHDVPVVAFECRP